MNRKFNTIMLFSSLMMMMTMGLTPAVTVSAQETAGNNPSDIWSNAYVNSEFPWGGNEVEQFTQYHTYETVKSRMMRLAADNPEIMTFHEGLNGGLNARGEITTADHYEGWYYGHASPWVKITGNVQGGDYNEFNGDTGNYPDRPDVMIVGNHHAREWMSYEVPMMVLETIAHYYNQPPTDNDGDGHLDEDPWGDADGDGQLDDDGDCLSLAEEFQDSNGDGDKCNAGDLGVDEDFSEQKWITDLINQREIYLIPLLNTDGVRYDHEVWVADNCDGGEAWENGCATSGWRKNLRDNTVTGVTPIPDLDEEVDPSCDGVDLNRNYQYEWGAPLGATGPLFPGMCYADGANNDVYNGPVDSTDQDEDGRLNEDHVDGKDDDGDGLLDEDWLGGNSEPETKFIQDMTEMNDDDGDGASDYKATLTYHSYSELVLYPWGHCTNCQSPDHDQLMYHGSMMAEMTDYANLQSSDLYPTSGDFCDWHYGVHGSYCYTMEIGTAFHQHPDDIAHIAVRNLGVAFYMAEIADNPRERADLDLANITKNQKLQTPSKVNIPESGPIPIEMCVSDQFNIDFKHENSHIMYRMVKPSRMQSDYGPAQWHTTEWNHVGFERVEGVDCELLYGAGNGSLIRAEVPVSDSETGLLHYKAMVSTLGGTKKVPYPTDSSYEVLNIDYRAPYGGAFTSLALFGIIAAMVWGGLGVCLRLMLNDEQTLAAGQIAEEHASKEAGS